MYKKRLLEDKIKELLKYFPVVAVLGARQVGKSTLINTIVDNLTTVVFDPIKDLSHIREDPDLFLQNQNTPLFLDEIQYAPELLASIKRVVDTSDKKGQYLLSGSQNFSVIKNLSESLAGRVAIVELWPMTVKEKNESSHTASILKMYVDGSVENVLSDLWGKPQKVVEHIWRGGYPGILEMPNHILTTYWESYLATYIERDVRMLADIKSLELFGRFVALLATMSAQEINANEIGRDLGVDRKTALHWISILEASFQWISIPSFSRNSIKKITQKKKGYFVDTGFACYLQKISQPDVILGHPQWGSLFESFVFLEIYRSIQAWDTKPNLYHFRAHSGAEVDLVLEINNTLYPIEIKAKSNPGKKDTRGIQSMKESFPNEHFATGLVICATEKAYYISEDIIAVPWWSI